MEFKRGSEWYNISIAFGILWIVYGLIGFWVEPGIKALAYFLLGCGIIISLVGATETTENRKKNFMRIATLVFSLAIILMFYSYIQGGEFQFALLNLLLITILAIIVIAYRIFFKKKPSETKPYD